MLSSICQSLAKLCCCCMAQTPSTHKVEKELTVTETVWFKVEGSRTRSFSELPKFNECSSVSLITHEDVSKGQELTITDMVWLRVDANRIRIFSDQPNASEYSSGSTMTHLEVYTRF